MAQLVKLAFAASLLAVQLVGNAAKLNSDGCYHNKGKGYTCPGQNTVQPWGGESTKEKTARLKRECKGRPNAGACLGYAT